MKSDNCVYINVYLNLNKLDKKYVRKYFNNSSFNIRINQRFILITLLQINLDLKPLHLLYISNRTI